ncbi:MAG: site-specific DNA-methyltransferase [Acidimicrobiaceae bacterium]|nr:site-specific DNA-methyltransferase [Acidimicrobiaceae bacterium]MYE76816.1 site-specific DNA-methyltransferase [Acidimicrobiaceae bacterium]MYJ43029.1 site-specific DNA-methyltransferase [Acidimicrobiaceae bacterium]
MARRAAGRTTDQYTHPSAKRANLPTEQTGKTMSDTDRRPVMRRPQTREIDDEPVLAWNRRPGDADGHAAHPLYVREKVHPAAFVKLLQGSGEQPQLFHDFNGLPSADAAYEWYQHAANWSNRLIHGECTRVMASLLARESMAGKVQMIYFDPPYGMGYKSNFQVSVNQRDRTPESAQGRPHDTRTIRAFRDTYERNIHSYLDLTREKLVLMRELLADSGSLFMQIGDENVHRAAILLDEVFGAENRIATIPFATTSGSSSNTLPSVADFLLWYAMDGEQVAYRQLYESLSRAEQIDHMSSYAMLELADGSTRALTPDERREPDRIPPGSRLFRRVGLTSQGVSTTGRSEPYVWNGKEHPCDPARHWAVSHEGLDRLAELDRLAAIEGGSLGWKRYENEVPGRRINNMWPQQSYASDKRYVVQTADSVIERCVLMATDPGDLVLDPTCGGATTAVAAEKWGRRWITCDTSPVAVSIARQRLATATFPYWTLADSAEGALRVAELSGKPEADPPEGGWGDDPARGFVYERVPQVSAAVLAYDLDADPIMLVDKPRKKRGVTRVASPMTVESEQPWATVIPLEGTDDEMVVAHGDFCEAVEAALLNHTVKGGRDRADITVRALEPWPGDSHLLAWKAVYTISGGAAEHTAAVMVAAEDVTVPGEMVREASREITDSAERADLLLVVAYAYAADAPPKVGRIAVARAQMNRDLMIRELSDEAGHEAFVIVGEPDIRILDDYPAGQIAVEVLGYDTFDPATGNAAEGGPDDVACWMLDTDHDGESFYARRIHFPGADNDRQIKKLLKELGRNADEAEQEALTAMRSAPFDPPERARIAVKIVTATGMEMTTVHHVS